MFFFFNDTATTEIYTLSLHDALPIYIAQAVRQAEQGTLASEVCHPACHQRVSSIFLGGVPAPTSDGPSRSMIQDRKSTRLNSSHLVISYAVFCLKKKKNTDHLHALPY